MCMNRCSQRVIQLECEQRELRLAALAEWVSVSAGNQREVSTRYDPLYIVLHPYINSSRYRYVAISTSKALPLRPPRYVIPSLAQHRQARLPAFHLDLPFESLHRRRRDSHSRGGSRLCRVRQRIDILIRVIEMYGITRCHLHLRRWHLVVVDGHEGFTAAIARNERYGRVGPV